MNAQIQGLRIIYELNSNASRRDKSALKGWIVFDVLNLRQIFEEITEERVYLRTWKEDEKKEER